MKGFRLGKVFDIDISVDWSWLLIFFLVVVTLAQGYFPAAYPGMGTGVNWGLAIIAALLLFAAVLVHELSHSLVAKRYGTEIKGITLFLFGGVSQTASEPKSAKEEFWMAIVGPLASLAIAAFFYMLVGIGDAFSWPVYAMALFGYLAFINLLLAIFNLIPGFPLDGGRVLRSAIWGATNNLRKATEWASYAGQAFGYLLMVFGFFSILFVFNLIGGLWAIFIGWFIVSSAKSSYQQVLIREALSGVHVDQVMTTDVPPIPVDMPVRQFVDEQLLKHDYSCYPVVSGEDVVGVVGMEEVRKVPATQFDWTPVGEIVHPIDGAYKVKSDDDAWDALAKLADESVCRLVVMDDNHLKGTVGRESVFRLVRHRMQLGGV